MTKDFSVLLNEMSSEDQAEIEARTQVLMAEMPLHELRRARGMTQKVLADILHIQQPAIAKIEQRTDVYISTLRSHVEAMGGELEVMARFPDGFVKITNFSKIGSPDLSANI